MRVAFTLIGGAGWTGGVNYLENLLSALPETPECNISPVLFAGTDTDQNTLSRLAPYLVEPPILSPVWDNNKLMKIARLVLGFGLQCDYLAQREFKRANIDVVFQHAAWYGCRFGIPTLAWIADFQHRHLPKMFSKINYYWRDIGYWALSHCATRLMVSSQDAQRDCETFYPKSIGRVEAVPFAVRIASKASITELDDIRRLYKLPEKFYFLPNQFWKHKNHLNVVEAMNLIKQSGSDIVLVASGNAKDGRNPDHPQRVLDLITNYNLGDKFMFLGLIPFQHILPLMRLSCGVVNPSFFEGWSTTVEEAKAVGAPLLLSDLSIHREQAEGRAAFFDPNSPSHISAVLKEQWPTLKSGPRLDAEHTAAEINQQHRKQFASAFGEFATRTLVGK
ncbi:putative glycosyltransferase [Methyloglobulus morosus KoM1]|uniref:Putative glycosyltransferase n=1 Tax=Methyloglobulus morosus KoM1 TaxID=1116472 RepID=V5BLB3_9GAMM|nr:glycosyltransferase family 1 protein [Methyloglobulus morosus]ESS74095.1 putative glycosyltransferase [Methyloglobulus morosus KoM1]